jgi:hypothetical protein
MSCRFSADRFDQHRPALTAADADRGDAAPRLGCAQRLQQVQDDACAGRADRVTDRNRAAVDVETIVRSVPSPRQPSCSRQYSSDSQAARQPSTCAAKASLISQRSMSSSAKPMALQDRRRRMHRAQSHLRRVEAGPLAVGDLPSGSSCHWSTAASEARISHAAPSVICELLPGVTRPYLRSKKGLSLPRPARLESARTPSSSHRPCLWHRPRNDLAEPPGGAGSERALVAAHAVFVHLLTRDAEAPGEVLGGLPHQQANHRVGQPLRMPITGDSSCDGRSGRTWRPSAPIVLACIICANQRTIASL